MVLRVIAELSGESTDGERSGSGMSTDAERAGSGWPSKQEVPSAMYTFLHGVFMLCSLTSAYGLRTAHIQIRNRSALRAVEKGAHS